MVLPQTTEEANLANVIVHKVFQAKTLSDKQQQMLDTRRDEGEPIPAPSKYKAYKGGITQITRQGVDTMADILYGDLDEEKKTLCRTYYRTSSSKTAPADHITLKAC